MLTLLEETATAMTSLPRLAFTWLLGLALLATTRASMQA